MGLSVDSHGAAPVFDETIMTDSHGCHRKEHELLRTQIG